MTNKVRLIYPITAIQSSHSLEIIVDSSSFYFCSKFRLTRVSLDTKQEIKSSCCKNILHFVTIASVSFIEIITLFFVALKLDPTITAQLDFKFLKL